MRSWQVWNFIQHFRVSKYWDNATDVTMPGYFKQVGVLSFVVPEHLQVASKS